MPGDPAEEQQKELVDRLAGLLPREELEDALKGLDPEQITGPGGLLTQLAGRVIETALGAELTEHLGYPPGRHRLAAPGTSATASTGKTVQTELGPVDVNTPRDRAGRSSRSWSPSARPGWPGLDEKILDLYAGGMSVRDIESHLQRLYGTTALGPRHDQPGHRRRPRRRRRVADPAAGAGLPDRLPRRADGQGPRGPRRSGPAPATSRSA